MKVSSKVFAVFVIFFLASCSDDTSLPPTDSGPDIPTVDAAGDGLAGDAEVDGPVFATTCESCHLRKAQLEASLAADPLPQPPGEGGSSGEG